eukprot:gene14589-18638_t
MQRLRMGLCGAGLVGQAEHAFYLWEDRDRFDFVALADASPKVRGALGERYAIPHLCADMGELLRHDLDAVVICVPDAFHPELAAQAFGAGLHVMCEKPLGRNAGESRQMVDAVERAGVANMGWYNYRRVPAVTLAKQLIDEGRLGKIFHYRAKFLQDWTISKDLPQGGQGLWRLDAGVAGSGVT